MKYFATAIWNGSGLNGDGVLTLQSQKLNQARYTFNSRFNSDEGTNPEELIAAAQASDFAMKLSFILDGIGFKATQLATSCHITFERGQISGSHLVLNATVPGIDEESFKNCAEEAVATSPVSRILQIKITIDVTLIN